MHAYNVSVYYASPGNQLNGHGRGEPFEKNVKIEQGSDFDVNNGHRLFLDAQEAKKVSQLTVVDESSCI